MDIKSIGGATQKKNIYIYIYRYIKFIIMTWNAFNM